MCDILSSYSYWKMSWQRLLNHIWTGRHWLCGRDSTFIVNKIFIYKSYKSYIMLHHYSMWIPIEIHVHRSTNAYSSSSCTYVAVKDIQCSALCNYIWHSYWPDEYCIKWWNPRSNHFTNRDQLRFGAWMNIYIRGLTNQPMAYGHGLVITHRRFMRLQLLTHVVISMMI